MDSVEMIPVQRSRIEHAKIIVRPDGAVDRKGASIILNKSAKTLTNWTLLGIGPRSWLIGGRRHYDYNECLAFARGEKSTKMPVAA